jgi:hypothetical protein
MPPWHPSTGRFCAWRTQEGRTPQFFFLSHPSSQVDIYNIYIKLPWLGSTPTSVFRVATHTAFFVLRSSGTWTVQFFGRVDVAKLPEVASENSMNCKEKMVAHKFGGHYLQPAVSCFPPSCNLSVCYGIWPIQFEEFPIRNCVKLP